MTIEIMGFVIVAVGLLTIRYGPDFGIYALMISTLFGAAAAVKLPALAHANVLPAHALLPFYLIAVTRLPRGVDQAMRSLAYPSPGFWLAAFTAYAVLSAVFLPRLFAGQIEVFSIVRDVDGRGGTFTQFLGPSAGNITQSLYLIGDLAVFAAVCAHACGRGLAIVVKAVLAAAAANIGFALADLVTYHMGMPDALEFMRNANYGMLVEAEISGFKRLVGSFSEASAFGGITLVYFAFCFELWLRGVHARASGILTGLSLAAVLAATSSSAYVALGVYAAVILLRGGAGLLAGITTKRAAILTVALFIGTVLVVMALALVPPVWTSLSDFVDRTLFNKLHTQSGIERSLWNAHAMDAFFESGGIGVGVGSVRASSFIVAVLANTGVIGLGLLMPMLASLAYRIVIGSRDRIAEAYAAAGGWACFALLISASLTASSVDLGLLFAINAAIVTAASLQGAAAVQDRLTERRRHPAWASARATRVYGRSNKGAQSWTS